jgi:hypothetical protein
VHAVKRALIILLVACGPKSSKPAFDTAKLARELHEDLMKLGEIAKQHRGDCPGLIGALEPHVVRMESHAAEVARAQKDDEVAKRLRADVKTYDDKHAGVADAIGADLGASYQTCPDNKQLLQLIDRIPEL